MEFNQPLDGRQDEDEIIQFTCFMLPAIAHYVKYFFQDKNYKVQSYEVGKYPVAVRIRLDDPDYQLLAEFDLWELATIMIQREDNTEFDEALFSQEYFTEKMDSTIFPILESVQDLFNSPSNNKLVEEFTRNCKKNFARFRWAWRDIQH